MAEDVENRITLITPHLHATSIGQAEFWDDAEITRFFDEQVKEYAKTVQAFVVRDNTSIVLVESQAAYSYPDRAVSIIAIALDGVPLIASTSDEMEALDDDYQTAEGTPEYWYPDKGGVNSFGLYPVPDGDADGKALDCLYHEYSADLDEEHENSVIPVHAVVGDYLELRVLGEAYNKESDGALPESARSARMVATIYSEALMQLLGGSQ